MKLLSFVFPLLILSAFSARGQVPSPVVRPGRPLTLSWPQQVRMAVYLDSLSQAGSRSTTEARQWRQAAYDYQADADASRAALVDERLLRENDQAETAKWRKRARKRGLLNWLGLAAAGGVGYLLLVK